MIKKSFTALLAAALLLGLWPSAEYAASAADIPAIEVVKSVNFRTGPSTSASRIRYLKAGERLTVLDKTNAYWLEVRDGAGTIGYVSNSPTYVTEIRLPGQSEASGTVIASVSFRTGPSTGAARMRYLQKGEPVWILERVNSYWYKAQDQDGIAGYVSTDAKYIQTTFGQGQNPGNPPPEEEASNATVAASVSFRTGPSTSAARMRYLQRGEPVWILDKVNSYWYEAKDKNGVIGYVSTDEKYILTSFGQDQGQDEDRDQILEGEEPTYIEEPNATVLASVSFRTGPSTSAARMRYLQRGEPVWILDKVNSYWYEAKDKNGVVGYVSTGAQYLTTTYVDTWKLLDPSVAAEMAIAIGLGYLGTPYEFGSSRLDTRTFDCSDFVRQAYYEATGFKLPGDSRQQGEYILQKHNRQVTTDWRQLRRGDLMFFMAYQGSKASAYAGIDKAAETIRHVGIYLGDGQILHTYSAESGGVRTNQITDSAWEYRFLYGGSVLK